MPAAGCTMWWRQAFSTALSVLLTSPVHALCVWRSAGGNASSSWCGQAEAKREAALPAKDDSQLSIMGTAIDPDPDEGSAARPSPMVEALSRKLPGALTTTCCCCSVRACHC